MTTKLTSLGNATAVPEITRQGNGKHSIVIVCSESNGKRITLSKSLTTDLGITENNDTVFLTCYKDSRSLVISSEPLCNESIKVKAKTKSDKATLYVGNLVTFVISNFGLADLYSDHVSHSFTEIAFETDGDCRYAIVSFN